MSKLQDLKNQGKIAGWWDFRKNSLLDQSGNGNDITQPTSASGHFVNTERGRGLVCGVGSSNYLVPHNTSLNNQDVTILVFGKFTSREIKTANPNLYCKRDASGNYLQFYFNSNGGLSITSGIGSSAYATDIVSSGANMVGVTSQKNGTPKFYKNGTFIGSGGTSNIYADTSATPPISIGQYYSGSTNNTEEPMTMIVQANCILTDQEISQIYNEYMQERGALRDDPTGWIWNNPLLYPEFNRDSGWTKGTGWTIANSKASSDGSQADVSNLSQAVLQIGRQYTVEYRVSGRSAGTVKPLCGTTEGTAVSADGVYSEILTCAGNTNFIIQANADFIGNIEFVNLQEGVHSIYSSDLSTVTPTLANVTAGEIGNSGFKVSTGTWKTSEDSTGKKWVENVVAGVAYQKSLEAYGTFVFEVDKAGQPFVGFMASVIGGESATGQTGSFWWGVSGRVAYRRSVSGVPSYVFYTVASYLTSGVAYKFAITKTTSGTMTWYIKGGVYTDWTLVSTAGGVGSNPVVGDTITSSKYMVLDLDAGDKFRLLGKHLGVLDIAQLTNLY